MAAGQIGSQWIEVALTLLVATSIAAGIAFGVIPPRRVVGRLRVPPERPAWPLLVVFLGTFWVLVLSQALIVQLAMGRAASAATQPAEPPLRVVALQSTVCPLAALLAMLWGDRAVRRLVGQDLGLGISRLRRGLGTGLLGAFILIPPLYLLTEVVERMYELVHYQHPTEHPLLKAIGERPGPGAMTAIIIGACIIAPVFEELLFRGHMQTLLLRMLMRLTRPHEPPPAVTTEASVAPVITYALPERPTTLHVWTAIVVTAALFAAIHPPWMQPIIFVLALGLGYAYERTGNLWVSITMHAMFNSVSTALFLTGLYAH